MGQVRDGIIKRGNTWSYVIRVTDSVTGLSKPKWVGGFETEAEAKAARDLARVSARRGEYVDRSRITVAQYLAEWLEMHAVEIKPRTKAGYRHLLNRYVVPRIGSMRLQAVRPANLTSLYRELLERGGRDEQPLSRRSVDYVHAVLRKALNDAVQVEQLLPSNPALRAKRPRGDLPSQGQIWTADESRRFLDAVAPHRLSAFYRLAAYTGARRGELLHLRWSDLDLEGGFVSFRGSVGIADGVRVEGTTKGGRERIVSIDPGTVAAMKAHRRRQNEECLVAGGSWVPGDLVFRRGLGDPLFPDTVTALMAKVLRQHNEQATAGPAGGSLRPARLHDLRHVHATLLLRAGVPVHVVSARLGHADPAITLRVYAHVLDEQAVEVAGVFAGVMGADDGPLEAADEGSVRAAVSKSVSADPECGG